MRKTTRGAKNNNKKKKKKKKKKKNDYKKNNTTQEEEEGEEEEEEEEQDRNQPNVGKYTVHGCSGIDFNHPGKLPNLPQPPTALEHFNQKSNAVVLVGHQHCHPSISKHQCEV